MAPGRLPVPQDIAQHAARPALHASDAQRAAPDGRAVASNRLSHVRLLLPLLPERRTAAVARPVGAGPSNTRSGPKGRRNTPAANTNTNTNATTADNDSDTAGVGTVAQSSARVQRAQEYG